MGEGVRGGVGEAGGGDAGNHGGIVAAVLGLGEEEGEAAFLCKVGEGLAEAAVEGDAAADGDGAVGTGVEGVGEAADEGIDDGFLVAGADGGDVSLGLRGVFPDVGEEGGLEAAEGDAELGAPTGREGVVGGDAAFREADGAAGLGGDSPGEAVDDGAAGVTEAEEFGGFVKGFAGGIVDGLAEEAEGARGGGIDKSGVAAADGKAELGP